MSGRRQAKSKSKAKNKGKNKPKATHKPTHQPKSAADVWAGSGKSPAGAQAAAASQYVTPPLPHAVSFSQLDAASRARLAALYQWPDPTRVSSLEPVAEALTAAPLILRRALEAALASGGMLRFEDLGDALSGTGALPEAVVDVCITLGVGWMGRVAGGRGHGSAMVLVRELAGPVAEAVCGVSRARLPTPDASDTRHAPAPRPPEAVYDHVILVAGTANASVKCTPKRVNAGSAKAYARHRGVDPDLIIEPLDLATANGSLRLLEGAACPDVPRLAQLFTLHDQAPTDFHGPSLTPLPPCGVWLPESLLIAAGADGAFDDLLERAGDGARDQDEHEDVDEDVLVRSRPPYTAPLKGWLTPAFEVVLEKEGTLADLAHLVACLDLQRLDRVASFRVTRTSIAMGARCGADLARVRGLLEGLCVGGVPASVTSHLDEWFAAALAPENLADAQLPPSSEPPMGWERFLAPPALPSVRQRVEQPDPTREMLDIERVLLLAMQRELGHRLAAAIPQVFQPRPMEAAGRALHGELLRLSPVVARMVRERTPGEGLRLLTSLFNPSVGSILCMVPRPGQAAELRRLAESPDTHDVLRAILQRYAPDKRGRALLPFFDVRYHDALRRCEEHYMHQLDATMDHQLEQAGALLGSCPLARQLNREAEVEGSMLTVKARGELLDDDWEDEDADWHDDADDDDDDDDEDWDEDDVDDDDEVDSAVLAEQFRRLLTAITSGDQAFRGKGTRAPRALPKAPARGKPARTKADPEAEPPSAPRQTAAHEMSREEVEATLNAAAAAELHCIVLHTGGASMGRVERMGPAGVVLGALTGKQEYVLFRDIFRVHVHVPK